MWHDLRQAIRMLAKHPGFVALTTLVLALGIDRATLVITPLVLAGVILLACYVPARGAGRVDPLRVLRRS